MRSVTELLNGRSDPGILIFNLKGQVTFANGIAWNILADCRPQDRSNNPRSQFQIPAEIRHIFIELKSRLAQFAWNSCSDAVYLRKTVLIEDDYYTLRGFINSDPKIRSSAQFLIQIEKFATRSKIDIEAVCAHFCLSRRIFQVVQLLAKGLTNKEIANNLDITETTVKDHIRKIMAKVKTTTRAGIVSKILTTSDQVMLEQSKEREKEPSGDYVYPLSAR